MRAALCLTVGLLAIVFVHAQTRCVSPKDFEANVITFDPVKQFFARGLFSYDEVRERTSMYEEVDATKREHFHHITLYKEKKSYHINLKTKECKSETITWKFHKLGVPANATFDRQAIIGTDAVGGAGVLVNQWRDDQSDDFWMGTFTDKECLMVTEGFFSNKTGFVHTSVYDITLGISDPNVFIPPSECDK